MSSSDPEYNATDSRGRLVVWCMFGEDVLYEPKYVARTLAFDPSAAAHHYRLVVYDVSDEATRVSAVKMPIYQYLIIMYYFLQHITFDFFSHLT